MKENIIILLQSYQENENIIKNTEIKSLRKNYTELTGLFKFSESMPLAVTLEKKNIMELDNLEYKDSINIRRNYCVTDKTDGERHILFINENGELFLINRVNNIKKTNFRCMNNKNCILDGELLLKNKSGQKIKKFLIFDLYFNNSNDVRERILNRTDIEKQENVIEKSRLEELDDLILSLDLQKINDNEEANLLLEKKHFRYGDILEYDKKTQNIIEKYNNVYLDEIKKEKPDMILINKLIEDIENAKQDTKIFKESSVILKNISDNIYDYETDGLIFTPIHLTVGEGENKRNKYGGRWNRIFKWKPSYENSIDFKVLFMKDKEGKDIEKYFNIGNEIKKFKKIKLMVGYDHNIHNKLNGLKIINEDPVYSSGYINIPFEPITNFHNNLYETYLEINKNGVVCKNGDIISNNSIIEFSYDLNKKINWVPLRRRNNLTPNALSTACNIWNTIFNPITIENITLGKNIHDKDIDYYNVDKDNNSPMKSIYKFHNLIKKNLLQTNCNKGDTLLDLSCGELGDLYKWISCELSFVVGIDINKNNLINETKGATTRLLDLKKKENNELLDNIFIIWGDSSKNISNGSAGLDSLNKFYIDLLWGNAINRNHIHRLNNKKLKLNKGRCQDKFNIISSQFSFHYFFKNRNTLDEYLKNVSKFKSRW